MSFIYKPIRKAVKSVSKVVTKPIKWIGDAITDVGDWVVDEIIDPVVTTVTDVVDAVLDDPIRAIAYAAAAASGQWWALPLVSGADTAIQGGDLGDILEASAKGYIAGQAGAYGAKYGAQAAASAGASTTAATIIGAGTGRAASAVVTGQDPVKAFVTGGIQAGVQAGLGYIDEQISGDTSGSTAAAVGDPGGAGDPGPVGQTQSFLDQNPVVKNIVTDTLSAALSGQDVTGATIMNAVIKGKVTTETVKNFVDADGSLTDGQIALITSSVQNVANATFSGADASDTLYATLNNYGMQELNKVIDKNVKNTIDKITGDYQKAETQANKIDTADKAYREDVQTYNGYVGELQNRISTRDGLKTEIDAAKATLEATDPNSSSYGGLVDAYNAKVQQFNDYAKEVDTYYSDVFKPAADPLKESINDQFAAIEADSVIYQDLKNELVSSSDQLDDVMIEVDNATQKAYVRAMTGDEFNVEEYKEINDLGDISNNEARFHWLTEGKDKKLNVNKVNYDKEAAAKEQSLFMQLVKETGVPVTSLTQDQIKKIQQEIKANETAQTYISDSLKGKFVEDDYPIDSFYSRRDDDDFEVFEDIKEELSAYTGDPGLAPEDYVLNEGVTNVDIGTGRAVLQPNENAELVWSIPELDVAKWDNNTGTIVKAGKFAPANAISHGYWMTESSGGTNIVNRKGDGVGAFQIKPVSAIAPGYGVKSLFPDLEKELNKGDYTKFVTGADGVITESFDANKYADAAANIYARNKERVDATLMDPVISEGYVLDFHSKAAERLGNSDLAVLAFNQGIAQTESFVANGGDVTTTDYYSKHKSFSGEFVADSAGNDLASLGKTNPRVLFKFQSGLSVEDTATIDSSVAGFKEQVRFGKGLYDLATNAVLDDDTKKTVDKYIDNLKGVGLENVAASVVDTIGGLTTMVMDVATTAVVGPVQDPKFTAAKEANKKQVRDVANKLTKMLAVAGGDLKSEDWKEASKDIYKDVTEANFTENEKGELVPLKNKDGSDLKFHQKVYNSAAALIPIITKGDSKTVVFFTEYVGAEVIEEGITAALGYGAGKYANIVAKAKGFTDEAAAWVGAKIGIGTMLTADIAEVAGQTYMGTFNEVKASAIKNGMSEADAEAYADSVAMNTASATTAVSVITNKIAGGAKLEEVIADTLKLTPSANKKVTEGATAWATSLYGKAKAIAGETVQETVESLTENVVKQYGNFISDKGLAQLDPEADVGADIAASMVLDAVIGAKTATTVVTAAGVTEKVFSPSPERAVSQGGMSFEQAQQAYGRFKPADSVLANALTTFNPQVSNIVYTAGDAEQAAQQLENLGLNDNVLKTDVLNTKFDSVVTTSTEAKKQFAEVNPEYKYSNSEIEDFTGFTADNDSDIETYVDDRFFDSAEVKAVAEAEGITLTDLQMERLSGQKDPFAATTNLQETLDSKATTYEEAEKYLVDLNYNPTVEEINNFVSQVNNEELTDADLGIVDDTENLEEFPIADLQLPDDAVDPAPTPTYEEEVAEEIKQYAEDRLTTEEEVITELENAGFDTSQLPEDFIDPFVKQGLQTDTLKEVIDASDPMMVDAKEVLEAYQEAGLSDVRPEDIDSLVGQYDEAELDARLKETLPTAQYNALKYDVGQLSDKLGGVDALGDQVGDVATDVAGLDVDIQSIADIIGKPATDVTDVDVDFVADLIAQTEALSDPSTFQFTDEQLGYDVTGDGIVDINDQNLLNNALQGQDVAFAQDSNFQPATGIFAQVDAQNQAQIDAQTQMQAQMDAQTQAAIDAQMQIAQQVEVNENKRNVRDLQSMLLEESNRTTAVKSLPVAEIGPAYDFGSIFRDTGQESFYKSPYARGGVVDANEELLRLIGGK